MKGLVCTLIVLAVLIMTISTPFGYRERIGFIIAIIAFFLIIHWLTNKAKFNRKEKLLEKEKVY